MGSEVRWSLFPEFMFRTRRLLSLRHVFSSIGEKNRDKSIQERFEIILDLIIALNDATRRQLRNVRRLI